MAGDGLRLPVGAGLGFLRRSHHHRLARARAVAGLSVVTAKERGTSELIYSSNFTQNIRNDGTGRIKTLSASSSRGGRGGGLLQKLGAAGKGACGASLPRGVAGFKNRDSTFLSQSLAAGCGWSGRSLDVADLDGAMLLAAALDVRDEHHQIALRNQGPPLEQLRRGRGGREGWVLSANLLSHEVHSVGGSPLKLARKPTNQLICQE